APGGRVVIVEYDQREATRWVPYPIPRRRLAELAAAAGLAAPSFTASRASAFGGELYVARLERLPGGSGVTRIKTPRPAPITSTTGCGSLMAAPSEGRERAEADHGKRRHVRQPRGDVARRAPDVRRSDGEGPGARRSRR